MISALMEFIVLRGRQVLNQLLHKKFFKVVVVMSIMKEVHEFRSVTQPSFFLVGKRF